MGPWSIDSDRNQPRRYVFNGQDRLYCAKKECGSYREATLKERIREKRIKKFPERVQDLIDDIALTHYADEEFLTPTEWETLWQRLINVEQRATAIHDREIRAPISDSDETQFGFELGHALRLLCRDTKSAEPLIWGIMQGMLASGRQNTDAQTKAIENILTKFEARIKQRRQRVKAEIGEQRRVGGLADDIEDRLNSCLRSNDIEATASEIGILDQFVGRMRANRGDYNLEADIESYVEQRNLSSLDSLRQQLEQDSEIVAEKSKQGVKVYKIFECMHRESGLGHTKQNENEQSRPDPPRYTMKTVHKSDFPIDTNKDNMLVAALKQLSNMSNGGLNPNRSAVKQVNNGWKLTTYGDLLCQTVFEEKDSTWVYTYATNPHALRARERYLIESCIS